MDAGNADFGRSTRRAIVMRGKRIPSTVSTDFGLRSKNVSPALKALGSTCCLFGPIERERFEGIGG